VHRWSHTGQTKDSPGKICPLRDNTVLVADHRLRRLFPEFLEVPVVAQSVRLHLPNESARSAVSYLKNWLRYQELELEMVGGEGDVELRVDGWSVNQLLVEGDLPAFGG